MTIVIANPKLKYGFLDRCLQESPPSLLHPSAVVEVAGIDAAQRELIPGLGMPLWMLSLLRRQGRVLGPRRLSGLGTWRAR